MPKLIRSHPPFHTYEAQPRAMTDRSSPKEGFERQAEVPSIRRDDKGSTAPLPCHHFGILNARPPAFQLFVKGPLPYKWRCDPTEPATARPALEGGKGGRGEGGRDGEGGKRKKSTCSRKRPGGLYGTDFSFFPHPGEIPSRQAWYKDTRHFGSTIQDVSAIAGEPTS